MLIEHLYGKNGRRLVNRTVARGEPVTVPSPASTFLIDVQNDDGQIFHVAVSYEEVYKILLSVRASDIAQRMEPEEFAQWNRLTQKYLSIGDKT